MKLPGKLRQVSRICFDIAAFLAAWEITFWLRVSFDGFFQKHMTRVGLEALVPRVEVILAAWITLSLVAGVYRMQESMRFRSRALRTVKSAMLAGLITLAAVFSSRQLGSELSRSFGMIFVPVSLVSFFVFALLEHYALRLVDGNLAGRRRVAIIGGGEAAASMIEAIRTRAGLSVELAGVIAYNGHYSHRLENQVRLLGSTEQLAELINREQLERLIVASREMTEAELEECGRISTRMGVPMSRVQTGFRPSQLTVNDSFGLPTLDVTPVSFTRGQEMVKRGLDIVGAAAALIVLSPVILILAGIIRWTSPGPAFFRSKRVGKGGRYFTLYKLRSMRTDMARQAVHAQNEKGGHIFKMKGDPRITPIGRFIRRYSLDELPQFYNVLVGDMSLVGPRPLPVEDLDPDGMSKKFRYWAEQRSLTAPGLTGLWQINGRSDTGFEQMVDFDVEYVQRWSIGLDLRILLSTPAVVLLGKGAY
jgi:exopolysaccharide biosynthesis polyprenyl glycosylphosphotransferase